MHGEAGFTLLELTIAMIFVGLLAAGIVITISTALNVWGKMLRTNEVNQEARAVMELLTRDIRDTYLGRNRDQGYLAGGAPVDELGDLAAPGTTSDVSQAEAPVDTLELTTASSSAENTSLLPEEVRSAWDQEVRPPVSDLMLVRWAERSEEAGQRAGLYRIRAVASNPQLGTTDPTTGQEIGVVSKELISDAVESLHFAYFDGENWLSAWDSRAQVNALPQAVVVQLVLNDKLLTGVPPATASRKPQHVFETMVSIATR